MSRIQVDKDYYIEINEQTENHEAKYDLHKTEDIVKDGEVVRQRETYKSIGHYNSVRSACWGILKYMTNKKLSKRKIATLADYIEDLDSSIKYMEKLMQENLSTEL